MPKTRTDLLTYYSRLVATLNKYMPDVGTDMVTVLDEEFRYLQRKKNVVKEFAEIRLKVRSAAPRTLSSRCIEPF